MANYKGFIALLILLLCNITTTAQNVIHLRDSLLKRLSTVSDREKVETLSELGRLYSFQNPDSGLYFIKQAMYMAQNLGEKEGLSSAYSSMGTGYMGLGKLDSAAWYTLEAKRMHEELKVMDKLVRDLNILALIYRSARNFELSTEYGQSALAILRSGVVADSLQVNASSEPMTRNILAWTYIESGKADSAAFMMDTIRQKKYDRHFEYAFPHFVQADIAYQQNKPSLATVEYRKGLIAAKQSGTFSDSMICQIGIARVHLQQGNIDSAIYYAMLPVYRYKPIYFSSAFAATYEILTEAYKRKEIADSALKYSELVAAEREKLYGSDKSIQLVGLAARDREEKRKIEEERKAVLRKSRTYALIAGLVVMFVVGLILYRSNQVRKKTNELLSRKNGELERAKQQVDNALTELKQAQSQLIQAEKMASLGELTAGIAHEIQNPLNFVNNFSEINIELAGEMTKAADRGDLQEVKELAANMLSNEEKINEHGRRADVIVKSMLQHSRSSSGSKEPTDLNKLADEYLKLVYHGMRAKDKSFNAELQMDFDPAVGMVPVVPQDIGRVLLNLFNNAFYAVNEKKRTLDANFQPAITVKTKRQDGHVIIDVSDNGAGIPEALKDKIFQPFFTTKPTGQGTGLGLSLSYDIVKAHGGNFKVVSSPGQGSTFTFQINA